MMSEIISPALLPVVLLSGNRKARHAGGLSLYFKDISFGDNYLPNYSSNNRLPINGLQSILEFGDLTRPAASKNRLHGTGLAEKQVKKIALKRLTHMWA
jgi:hypothetical protein